MYPRTSLIHIYNGGFSPDSSGERISTSGIDLSPDLSLVNFAVPSGMSTKTSRRLARHWMGLSLEDNWLPIRDGDNNVRVSRKAVNHYLSVRRPCLLRPRFYSLHSPSISLFNTVHSEVSCSYAFSCIVLCCSPWWYLQYVQRHFRMSWRPFRGVIAQDVVPILKVSHCHQLIVATHVLLGLKARQSQ